MQTLGFTGLLLTLLVGTTRTANAQQKDVPETRPVAGDDQPKPRTSGSDEPTTPAYQLSDLTVYGKKIPGSVFVYEVANDPRTLTEDVGHVLQRIPGFNLVEEHGTGLWSNVGIRGVNPLRGRGVLTLLDGAPAMLSLFGDNDWHVLPSVEQLERIETVKGGASVLYGPNAIGGVVNFVTKDIPTQPVTRARTTFGSDNLVIGELSTGGMWGDTGYSVSHTHKQTDGWRDNSAMTTDDMLFKFGTRLGQDDQLKFMLNYFQSDSDTPGALSPAEFQQDASQSFTPNDRFRGNRLATNTQYTHFFGEDHYFQPNFYAQRMERVWRIARRSTTSADIWDMTGTFAGLEPKYFLAWDGLSGRRNELTAGVRLHAERSERVKMVGSSPTANTGPASIIDVWDAVEFAPYVQNDFELLDDFHLTAGLRYEWYRLSIENQIQGVKGDSTVHEPIWGIGARYKVGEGTFFAGVNRYLDPPQPQEEVDTSTGARRNLKNAVGMNYEVGVRSDHIAWLPTDLTFFWLDYDDQVVRQGLVYSNVGKSMHRGVELASVMDLGHFAEPMQDWDLYGNATLLDTEIQAGQYDGNDLAYAPKFTLNSGVRYTDPSTDLSGYFEGTHTGSQFSDPANTGPESADGAFGLIESRTIYNAGLSYKHAKSGATFFAGVKNLFDERYVSMRWIWWGGQFPGAARTWFLGASISF